jgi:hypothetical protein
MTPLICNDYIYNQKEIVSIIVPYTIVCSNAGIILLE